MTQAASPTFAAHPPAQHHFAHPLHPYHQQLSPHSLAAAGSSSAPQGIGYPQQQQAAKKPKKPISITTSKLTSATDRANGKTNKKMAKNTLIHSPTSGSTRFGSLTSSTTTASAVANGKRKMTPMSAFRPSSLSSSETSSSAATAAKKKLNAEKHRRNSRACTACQKLKMRCSGPTADGPCERCLRTGKECMVQERAPRRPWTKKKDMQIQQLTNRLEEMEDMLRSAFTAGASRDVSNINALNQFATENGLVPAAQPLPPPPQPPQLQTQPQQPIAPQINVGRQDQASHLQQPKLKQQDGSGGVGGGTSSVAAGPSPGAIANWLTLTNAPTTPSTSHELDLAYVDAHREQLPFVSTGRVSPTEAVEMFHLFMNSCVVHTVILDPEWHTVPRVGDASPFLFAVILYIAATYHRERKTLRQEMAEEMNILVGQVITSGPKSIEVVQAFLLLYQWNSPSSDPADDRAWLLSGIAIRLATEMQLHKAQKRIVAQDTSIPFSPNNNRIHKSQKGTYLVETDRERINRERCWIMAFAVDRSLSFAVGRSWTISEKAELVRDSDHWWRQPGSRAWDRGISAFVDLQKTTSRQADVLHTAMSKWGEAVPAKGRATAAGGNSGSSNSGVASASHEQDESDFDCETMMRIMNDELEAFKRRWLSRDFFALTADISPEVAAAAHRAHSTTVNEKSHDDGASSTSSVTVHTENLDVHLRALYYITKQAWLRYNFAVLVLNCFGLQYSVSRPSLTHAKTLCITHAVRAAQGLVKAATEGLQATMTYAPHTQFTILSFGAISLIKLSSLVDEVVAARLIEQVRKCVTFLESIAIASDHTPARLASLVRAMLRSRDQRIAIRASRAASRSRMSDTTGSGAGGIDRRSSKGGGDSVSFKDATDFSPFGRSQRQEGETMNSAARSEQGQRKMDKDDGEDEDMASDDDDADEEEDTKPNAFAPGMEIHKLPQRSSRAVTPEDVSMSSHLNRGGNDMIPMALWPAPQAMHDPHHRNGQSAAIPEFVGSNALQSDHQTANGHVEAQHHQQRPPQNAANLWTSSENDDFMSSALPAVSAFDPEVEATLQSLGFTSNIGTAGWSHMSAEEILDDSFWLRLPDRGGQSGGGTGLF